MEEYNGIKIGDLITAYNAGYHRVVMIEERDDISLPLFHFKRVYDSKGNKKGGRVKTCASVYCKPASIGLIERINQLNEEITRLEGVWSEGIWDDLISK